MRYFALATDYDGTLAQDGQVAGSTIEALKRFSASGRRLILVTGRILDELLSVFPRIELFDLVVAENGGLIYCPDSRESIVLAEPPDDDFIAELRYRGVSPLAVGRVITATRHPHEVAVLESIRDLNLELQVIFNKGAVMVLPAGINKAAGLREALARLGLAEINVAGIGDAENDHSFLQICGLSAAVANALPALKEEADWIAGHSHGAGVEELIGRLLESELVELEPLLKRHHLTIGKRHSGEEETLPLSRNNLLVAGASGSGKSTLVTGLLERMSEKRQQYCVIDPEGDYEQFESAVSLGTGEQGPSALEVMQVLDTPEQNVSVNLVGVPLSDRPRVFLSLLTQLQDLRMKCGRPHWIVIDEAHHVLPKSWDAASYGLPQALEGAVFVTLRPGEIVADAARQVTAFLGVSETANQALAELTQVLGLGLPELGRRPDKGQLLYWNRGTDKAPEILSIIPGTQSMRRHKRKYAEGELPPERSFFFRGPEEKLNLRAQNLIIFMQMARGVDDDTWLFHLRQGDFSRWFHQGIKDDDLGEAAESIEKNRALDAAESRKQILAKVASRYTLGETSESAG